MIQFFSRYVPWWKIAIVPAAIILIGFLVSWWLTAGICLGLALSVGLTLAAILS